MCTREAFEGKAMHELSIAAEIIDAASVELRQTQGLCAQRLRVRVGGLSGVNPENLRFCLEVARDGTPLGPVQIDVECVRAKVLCPACGEVDCGGRFDLACPRCGGSISGFLGGNEIEVALECEEMEEGRFRAD